MSMTFETDIAADANNTRSIGTESKKFLINGLVTGSVQSFYGECKTAGDVAGKAAVCTNFTADALIAGATVKIKFDFANTAANPTMSINNLEPVNLMKRDLVPVDEASWEPGQIVTFTYDGAYWLMNDYSYDAISNATIDSMIAEIYSD